MSTVERESTANINLQGLYFEEIGRYDLLTGDQEVELAQSIEAGRTAWNTAVEENRSLTGYETELFKEGIQAREAFINANLRLVIHVARPYCQNNVKRVDPMDVYQMGNLGLEHAVEKFDWRQGYKFSTYATNWILQKITRGLRDQSHMPLRSSTINKHLGLLAFYEDFYNDEGQIIDESGWNQEHLDMLRTLRIRNGTVVSLDRNLYRSDNEEANTLYDYLPHETSNEIDLEESADAPETLRQVLEVAKSALSEEDYLAYMAMLKNTEQTTSFSNLANELGRTTLQLQAIRQHVYAILRHPSIGIAAYRDQQLEWQQDGACRDTPSEIFFPKRGESTGFAQKFCAECPVQQGCLDFAVESVVKVGIWGGESERKRRLLRKQRGLENNLTDQI